MGLKTTLDRAGILLTVMKAFEQVQRMNMLCLMKIVVISGIALFVDEDAVRVAALVMVPTTFAILLFAQGRVFGAIVNYLHSALEEQ